MTESIEETVEETTLTDEEFVANEISDKAIKVLEFYIEPDGENKTVIYLNEPTVLCQTYVAIKDSLLSNPAIAKLVITELTERQKQAQLNQILLERQINE